MVKSLYWLIGKIKEQHPEVVWLDSNFWVKEVRVKIFGEGKDLFLFSLLAVLELGIGCRKVGR